MVGQVERALLVDVIGRGALADIDVPKAEHLITLNLDLSLAIVRRDSCAVRWNSITANLGCLTVI